jgi:hypothetical protein
MTLPRDTVISCKCVQYEFAVSCLKISSFTIYTLNALLLSNSMEPSPYPEANCSIKFPELYGIRIPTEELANCMVPGPNSSSPSFPQLFLMTYFTFVLLLTPTPSKWSSISVSSPNLCMHFPNHPYTSHASNIS